MSIASAPNPGLNPLPRHIAIIMDGNRRWAKARMLPRTLGHRQGVNAVREVVRAAGDIGLEVLTLYSFSSENWNRPADEVSDLMGLLRWYIREDLAELNRKGVRIRIIGSRDRVAPDIVGLIDEAEKLTAANRGLTLAIAFNYGGQDEILAAVKDLAREVAEGRLRPDEITKDMIAGRLCTAGIPNPDLVIRTSGEKRLSNFLLWQTAYAELVFDDIFWPDFTKQSLLDAVAEYQRRHRRYGAS